MKKCCFLLKTKYLLVLISVCLMLLPLCGCESGSSQSGDSPLDYDLPEIYFFNAGDADSILVIYQDYSMLIDCGNKGFGNTILAHLEELGTDRLDYLVISHFDKDHVGGASQILRSIPVDHVLQSVTAEDSTVPDKYANALSNGSISVQTLTQPVHLESGELKTDIFPPAFDTYKDKSSNNSSLIISTSYADTRVLFTGDAEDERINEFLSNGAGQYDLIKMPHHGKWSGSIKDLLETTQPTYAVICCEERSDVSSKTEKALTESDTKTFFTGNGPITAVMTGAGIKILQN